MTWDDSYLSEGQGLDVSVRRNDDGSLAVVAVAGALDISSASVLDTALDAEIERAPATLVVDLTAVTVLSSPGIAVLLRAHRGAGPVRLCLVVDSDHVHRPLDLLGITEVIPMFRTLEDAVPRRG